MGVLATGVACVAVAVTGCGGSSRALKPHFPVVSASPTMAPSTPAAPTSSDSPVAVASSPVAVAPTTATPVTSAPVYPTTEAGAYAIAEAIVKAGGEAGRSGDLSQYRLIAASDCPCIRNVQDYIAHNTSRGTLTGGIASAFKHVAYKRVTSAIGQVFISYSSSVTVLTSPQGAVLGRSKPVHNKEDAIDLRDVSNFWKVTSINPFSSGGN